jgi:hypothetical protein
MGYVNCSPHTLVFAGVPYPSGAEIPDSVDPVQVAYFATLGVVEPTTAPASAPLILHRVSSSAPSDAVKEATHGDDGSE